MGALHTIETNPASLITSDCSSARGAIGTVVLVPHGSNDAEVAFKVTAGFGRTVADCLGNFGPGCIVARRALRYLPHTPLFVPVSLDADCDGIACGETTTCSHGNCVTATVDPNACAAPGGCSNGTDAGPPGSFHDVANPAYWSTFNVGSLQGGPNGFGGVVFDGRFVHFVPNFGSTYDGLVARYDTQGVFNAASGWTTFDTSTVNPGAIGFEGGAFDGRYVYFVPNHNTSEDGLVTRYDTQAAFGTSASWSTFDVATVNPGAIGFQGGVFDGRYLYLVPYRDPGPDGIVARYDTQSAFNALGSWATFDLSFFNAAANGFAGGTFDGRYVYFVPATGTTVARYDTQGGFGTLDAWSRFDLKSVYPSVSSFLGAVFDERYVYFIPKINGVVARYDTQGAFESAAGWGTFDVSSVNASAMVFAGGAFDGRYVYLVPGYTPGASTMLMRYDTNAMFTTGSAWSGFDLGSLGIRAGNFGAAFDGEFLYISPLQGTVSARFDARAPPALPPGYRGSFF